MVVKELDDAQVLELALIENLQRQDLNPIEEAQGYQSLIVEYGQTQESVAERVGRSRPAVANALRLLNLPPAMQQLVKDGTLSAGHARALLPLPPAKQLEDVYKRQSVYCCSRRRPCPHRLRKGGSKGL